MKQSSSPSLFKQSRDQFSDVMTVVYEQNIEPSLVLAHRLPLEKRFNLWAKRGFDLVISSFLLFFIMSWLFPLLAILVWIDSRGPVFFVQKRNSRQGKNFTCIKFRTMVVNREADHLPAKLNDHRITRVGEFLRRNHLDELPQLLNVWWGHMSLIGPRPHMISDNLRYSKLLNFYAYRHKVKPGMTGLAQVHGYVGVITDLKDMRERVKKDIFYIHHWSFLLDLQILGMTMFKMFPAKKENPSSGS